MSLKLLRGDRCAECVLKVPNGVIEFENGAHLVETTLDEENNKMNISVQLGVSNFVHVKDFLQQTSLFTNYPDVQMTLTEMSMVGLLFKWFQINNSGTKIVIFHDSENNALALAFASQYRHCTITSVDYQCEETEVKKAQEIFPNLIFCNLTIDKFVENFTFCDQSPLRIVSARCDKAMDKYVENLSKNNSLQDIQIASFQCYSVKRHTYSKHNYYKLGFKDFNLHEKI